MLVCLHVFVCGPCEHVGVCLGVSDVAVSDVAVSECV